MSARFSNGCVCNSSLKNDCLFKVKSKWEDGKLERVFATKEDEDGNLAFLIFYIDEWKWVFASNYEPIS